MAGGSISGEIPMTVLGLAASVQEGFARGDHRFGSPEESGDLCKSFSILEVGLLFL